MSIVDSFTGEYEEPANESEKYILKSMWVMMLAEFEGSVKGLAESYIDKIKKADIGEIHVCLLLQHFYPDAEDTLSLNKIISVYKKNPQDINYAHFTGNRKPKYKRPAIEKLFNTLGIFFSSDEITQMKSLDSIAQTRDAIAHGDLNVQITRKEFKDRLSDVSGIYDLLIRKLNV